MELERISNNNLDRNDYHHHQHHSHHHQQQQQQYQHQQYQQYGEDKQIRRNEDDINNVSMFKGPLNEKNMNFFLKSLQQAETIEKKIELICVLLKTDQETSEKFADSKGMSIIKFMLSKCLIRDDNPYIANTNNDTEANNTHATTLKNNIDLIEKIFGFLNKITITKKILTNSRIHKAVEDIKNSEQYPEELSGKAFKLLIKWKSIIEEWVASGGEHIYENNDIYGFKEKNQLKDEKSTNLNMKNYLKRTNYKNTDKYYDRRKDILDTKKTRRRDRIRPSKYDDSSKSKYGRKKKADITSHGLDYRKTKNNSRYNNDHGDHPRDHNREREHSERDHDRKIYKRKREISHDLIKANLERKTVNWEAELKLLRVRYFRAVDESSHPGLNQQEVEQIQKETKDSHLFSSSEEYKHKESQMEGRSMKMIKNSEKQIQEKLDAMCARIPWTTPKKLSLGRSYITPSQQSIEKAQHEERISNKIPCFYLKDYQIPDQPSFDNIMNSSTSTSDKEIITIPLQSNLEGGKFTDEPFELAELREMVVKNNPELSFITDIEVKERSKSEISKQDKTPKNQSAKPLKSILKKSKYSVRLPGDNGNENKEDLTGKKSLDKEEKKPDLKIPQELILKLINQQITKEEFERSTSSLENAAPIKDLLMNISTIKNFLSNMSSQNTSKIKKTQKTLGINLTPKKHKSNTDITPVIASSDEPSSHDNIIPNINNNNNKNIELNRLPPTSDTSIDHSNTTFQSMDLRNNDRMMMTTQTTKVPYRPPNYKTVPCRMFHSPVGCTRGDGCHFIHDLQYAGKETPNMHKYVRPMDSLTKTRKGPGGQDDYTPQGPYDPSMASNYPQASTWHGGGTMIPTATQAHYVGGNPALGGHQASGGMMSGNSMPMNSSNTRPGYAMAGYDPNMMISAASTAGVGAAAANAGGSGMGSMQNPNAGYGLHSPNNTNNNRMMMMMANGPRIPGAGTGAGGYISSNMMMMMNMNNDPTRPMQASYIPSSSQQTAGGGGYMASGMNYNTTAIAVGAGGGVGVGTGAGGGSGPYSNRQMMTNRPPLSGSMNTTGMRGYNSYNRGSGGSASSGQGILGDHDNE